MSRWTEHCNTVKERYILQKLRRSEVQLKIVLKANINLLLLGSELKEAIRKNSTTKIYLKAVKNVSFIVFDVTWQLSFQTNILFLLWLKRSMKSKQEVALWLVSLAIRQSSFHKQHSRLRWLSSGNAETAA